MHDWVREASPVFLNKRVDTDTLESLECYREAAPKEIAERLRELDDEWDVECVSDLFAQIAGIGGILVAMKKPKAALPIVAVLGARLLTGWRPLLPLIRFMGFRSAQEIGREFHGLKALRGDYRRVQIDPTAKGALTTAQGETGVESTLTGTGPAEPKPYLTPVHRIPQYPIQVK